LEGGEPQDLSIARGKLVDDSGHLGEEAVALDFPACGVRPDYLASVGEFLDQPFLAASPTALVRQHAMCHSVKPGQRAVGGDDVFEPSPGHEESVGNDFVSVLSVGGPLIRVGQQLAVAGGVELPETLPRLGVLHAG
jgi:hypothetical protein